MSKVEATTIARTLEMAGLLRKAVVAGKYASTSWAIREAVPYWKERRELLGYSVDELRGLDCRGGCNREKRAFGPANSEGGSA